MKTDKLDTWHQVLNATIISLLFQHIRSTDRFASKFFNFIFICFLIIKTNKQQALLITG